MSATRRAICWASSMKNQPTIGARLTAPTNSSVNYIRPYTGYAGITSRFPAFTNNYNALQFSANHRSHGLQLGVAYTFSKDLTTNTSDRSNVATNSYDFSFDYGPANYNQKHTFTANYVYELPWFRQQSGFEGRVLGGWQVSGITQFLAGQNFSLSQARDPWDPNGLNVGIGLGATRPDQVSAVQKSKTVDAWFSTSSFAHAWGHFGSEGNAALSDLDSTTGIWRQSKTSDSSSGSRFSCAANSSTPSTMRASPRLTAQLMMAALVRSRRGTNRAAFRLAPKVTF